MSHSEKPNSSQREKWLHLKKAAADGNPDSIDAVFAGEEVGALLGHTGWLNGGIPSINTDATKGNLSAGCGWVSDHSVPENPTRTFVEWTEKTGIVLPNITADSSTGVGIDKNGDVVLARNGVYDPVDYREQITLGSFIHPETTVTIIADIIGMPAYDGALATADFLRFVTGPANAGGNIISANGTNLSLNISAGRIMGIGIAARVTPESPHILPTDALTTIPIYRTVRSSLNADGVVAIPSTAVTTVDPNGIDNGSGTVGVVGNNKVTIQVLYWVPANNFALLAYGQKEYISLATALDDFNAGGVGYEEREQVSETAQRAYIFVQQGATDLTNVAQAIIREAPKLRTGPIGIS